MVNNKNFDIVVRKYPQQKYYTFFNKKTGLFMRVEEGSQEPFWSECGPELLDISITNWCDRECYYCYRNSNKNGHFITLEDYNSLLLQASKLHVLQVALGGGNPNQHPAFIDILQLTREKYDIIPSYTTNGRGFTTQILEASKKYCGAVAVSAHPPFLDMERAIMMLIKFKIKTNIHFVLSNDSIDTAISWLESPPEFLAGVNAIVFLNYKPVGENACEDLLLRKSKLIQRFFNLISNKKYPFKIGFDSCSISGVVSYMNIDSKYIEPCEAARFSAFISEDMRMYPCSFMVDLCEGVDLGQHSLYDAWHKSEQFKYIRQILSSFQCNDCQQRNNCFGGCPIFKDINLCGQESI